MQTRFNLRTLITYQPGFRRWIGAIREQPGVLEIPRVRLRLFLIAAAHCEKE
jgi:hypothetical protein